MGPISGLFCRWVGKFNEQKGRASPISKRRRFTCNIDMTDAWTFQWSSCLASVSLSLSLSLSRSLSLLSPDMDIYSTQTHKYMYMCVHIFIYSSLSLSLSLLPSLVLASTKNPIAKPKSGCFGRSRHKRVGLALEHGAPTTNLMRLRSCRGSEPRGAYPNQCRLSGTTRAC